MSTFCQILMFAETCSGVFVSPIDPRSRTALENKRSQSSPKVSPPFEKVWANTPHLVDGLGNRSGTLGIKPF